MYKVTFLTRGGKKRAELSDTITEGFLRGVKFGRVVLTIDLVQGGASPVAQSVATRAVDLAALDVVVVNATTGGVVAAFTQAQDATEFIARRRSVEGDESPTYDVLDSEGVVLCRHVAARCQPNALLTPAL